MHRVAHLLEVPLHGSGGLNVLVRELAAGLSKTYETFIFCPKPDEEVAQVTNSNCGINHMPWKTGSTSFEVFDYLVNKIKDLKIEVLLFHGGDFSWGPERGLFSMVNRLAALGCCCIFVNHQSSPFGSHLPTINRPTNRISCKSLSRFMLSWTLKAIQLTATKTEICVSVSEMIQAKKRYFFLKNKFINVYHSRLDVSPITKSKYKKKIILCVGHFAFRKGQHILIDAFGRIARNHLDWELQLVGASTKDQYFDYLSRQIEHHGISAQTQLLKDTKYPDEHFREASIYVQPSIFEAYGLALQEAMHFGCACVGSDSGGIRDSILDKELLFPARDDLALSFRLDKLMAYPSYLLHCQEAAHNCAISFNRYRKQMLNHYCDVIDGCIDSKS